ncbi:TonB-dependent receptor [Rheinheimera texasensis]|uniref:TonB-dependent receptor n=1 Tax=Rheinheimera texasensis TaxID=306205 RepID=UPI0032B17F90
MKIGNIRRQPALTMLALLVSTTLQAETVGEKAAGEAVAADEATVNATAQHESLEHITVSGRAQDLRAKALTASEGIVSGRDLLIRPLVTTAELLQAVPGLIAAQHSGTGKANQYFLRGFQLDHGTDFTASLDGAPLNLRSHGHGQGYLDLNGVLPESIASVEYRKGPYFADNGDFSLAGSARLRTIDALEQSYLSLEAGSFGQRKLGAGLAVTAENGAQLTLLGQHRNYDGPWQLAEQLSQQNLFAKYYQREGDSSHALTLTGYQAHWRPTEQIPESAIGTPQCADRFCDLDSSARGQTRRLQFSQDWQTTDLAASWYAQYYDWFLLSNPTYTDDGQIQQRDQRYTLGGRSHWTFWQQGQHDARLGLQWQHDAINPVGLDQTVAGEVVKVQSEHRIGESSAAVYAEQNLQLSPAVRLNAAARYDWYRFAVTSLLPPEQAQQQGQHQQLKEQAGIFTPKLNLSWQALETVSLYASAGRGFHSNDARGLLSKTDPVAPLSPGKGAELGSRWVLGDLRLSYHYWWLALDSELIFVGDSNSVEPKGGADRQGYELSLYWPLGSGAGRGNWSVDGNYSVSQAQYKDPLSAGGRFVEGSIGEAAEVGLSFDNSHWQFSSRLRYQSGYALTPDNSERAGSQLQWHLRLARQWQHWSAYAEVLNLTDRQGQDIVYFYENAYDPDGGRVSRAQLPRSVRLGLSYRW